MGGVAKGRPVRLSEAPFGVPTAWIGRETEAEERPITIAEILLLVRLAGPRPVEAILAEGGPKGAAALVAVAAAPDAARPPKVEVGVRVRVAATGVAAPERKPEAEKVEDRVPRMAGGVGLAAGTATPLRHTVNALVRGLAPASFLDGAEKVAAEGPAGRVTARLEAEIKVNTEYLPLQGVGRVGVGPVGRLIVRPRPSTPAPPGGAAESGQKVAAEAVAGLVQIRP